MSNFKLIFYMLIISFLLVSCVQNGLYRGEGRESCSADQCTSAVIEKHEGREEDYELAFVEFSERGNAFDRDKMNEVINYIESEEKGSKNGIMLLVYTHGWHHNAGNDRDGDVRQFRKILKIISKNDLDHRKVIGVYLGWRGESLNLSPVNLITYWGRKNTAHQVGNGGVSELLLRLNKISRGDRGEKNENIFVVTGHSFGAALILAAMKDTLLHTLVEAKDVPVNACGMIEDYRPVCQGGCYKTRSFGDGIVLINPAVEANELMQIHELLSETRCYSRDQPKLLHIVSTDKDWANRSAFQIGQLIGVSLLDKEKALKRKKFTNKLLEESDVTLREHKLDTVTVGNYPPFRTGRVKKGEYTPCHQSYECLDNDEKEEYGFHIMAPPFSPISIIYGDRNLSKGHNDVFNDEMLSYIAASVFENKYKKHPAFFNKEIAKKCIVATKKNPVKTYNFGVCQKYFKAVYTRDF